MSRPRSRQSRSAAPPQRKPHHSSIYLPWPVYWVLHDIAGERGRATGKRVKIHDLLMDGLDAVLKRHGKPSIAALTKAGGER
jgi:hypothetical protein